MIRSLSPNHSDEVLALYSLIEDRQKELSEKDDILIELEAELQRERDEKKKIENNLFIREAYIRDMEGALYNMNRQLLELRDREMRIQTPESLPSPDYHSFSVQSMSTSFSSHKIFLDRMSPSPSNFYGSSSPLGRRGLMNIVDGRPMPEKPDVHFDRESPINFVMSDAPQNQRIDVLESENKRLRSKIQDQDKILLELESLLTQQQTDVIDISSKLRLLTQSKKEKDKNVKNNPLETLPSGLSSPSKLSSLPPLFFDKHTDMSLIANGFQPLSPPTEKGSSQIGRRRQPLLSSPCQRVTSQSKFQSIFIPNSDPLPLVLPWETSCNERSLENKESNVLTQFVRKACVNIGKVEGSTSRKFNSKEFHRPRGFEVIHEDPLEMSSSCPGDDVTSSSSTSTGGDDTSTDRHDNSCDQNSHANRFRRRIMPMISHEAIDIDIR